MRETCTHNNCSGLVKARGMCNRHYLEKYRAGTLNKPNRTERVLEFIDKCVTSSTDDCIMPDFKSKSDYPSFVLEGKYYKVGWLVLEKTAGHRPTPQMIMRHIVCGNARCCNPRHIVWGTQKENASDRKRHGTEPCRKGTLNSNYRHGRYVK